MDTAKSCSFSEDLKYLGVSGDIVKVFAPHLEHYIDEVPSLNKVAAFNPNSDELIS